MARKPDKPIDAHSGTETTGHEWDGVTELNTPLPRWWLWIFYATIVWSIGYWVAMPAWPTLTGFTPGLLNHSQRADVDAAVRALQAARAQSAAKLDAASLAEIEQNPELLTFALAMGRSAFGDNCATCHGSGAQGFPGYPNLNDDVWLWGGTLDDIRQTLRAGIRSDHPDTRLSMMPAYGRDKLLEPAQIRDLTEYVVALSGHEADAGAVERARPVFAEQCAACHGAEGKGDRQFGSPDLTDAEWLFGGSRAEIEALINRGGGSVMPSFERRLDPVTIKALAVYVHALGGGE